MSKSETLRIVDISQPLEQGGESVVYAADRRTGQMSFEAIEDIKINNKSTTTEYFSAKSLERRVRGYHSENDTSRGRGEIDIVTPLLPGEVEQF